MIAAVFVIVTVHPRPGERIGAIFQGLFPRDITQNASAILDAKVYAINSVLTIAALNSWIFGSDRWRGWVAAWIAQIFGEPSPSALPSWATRILMTVALALAFESGYYAAHWLCHRTPLLWRFHRMHHSASVLTPLTGLRAHPVDTLLFGNIIGLCTGFCAALLAYPLGAGADAYLLFQTNALLFVYALTLESLRHSHLWLRFTGPAAYVFQSPAHHQLHHSRDPADYDRNFGFSLAVLDSLFGTLAVPQERQPLRFGLVDAPPDPSVHDFYFGPIEGASADQGSLENTRQPN